MVELRHEIEIGATPAAIWAVLAEFEGYSRWNPFIRRVSGEIEVGAKLEVEIAPPGGRAMTFKPTVLVARRERELRWLGRLVFRGLLDGEHTFRLEPLPGGRTRFTQSERFRGVLVRPLERTLGKTLIGFEQMNEALKAEVEARIPGAASLGPRR